jgi:hypothetical protein
MKMDEIKKIAQDKLLADGYDMTSGHSYAIAKKDVDSTGGDSNILVWLTKGDEYHEAVLTAEYTTRGNNVLSTSGISFENGISDEKINLELDNFITRVKEIMDKSITKKVSNKEEQLEQLEQLDAKYVASYNILKSHQDNFEKEISKMPSVNLPEEFELDIGVSPNPNYQQTVSVKIYEKTGYYDSSLTGVDFHIEDGKIPKIDCLPSTNPKITDIYIELIKAIKENPETLINNLNSLNALAVLHMDVKKDYEELNNKIKEQSSTKKTNKYK